MSGRGHGRSLAFGGNFMDPKHQNLAEKAHLASSPQGRAAALKNKLNTNKNDFFLGDKGPGSDGGGIGGGHKGTKLGDGSDAEINFAAFNMDDIHQKHYGGPIAKTETGDIDPGALDGRISASTQQKIAEHQERLKNELGASGAGSSGSGGGGGNLSASQAGTTPLSSTHRSNTPHSSRQPTPLPTPHTVSSGTPSGMPVSSNATPSITVGASPAKGSVTSSNADANNLDYNPNHIWHADSNDWLDPDHAAALDAKKKLQKKHDKLDKEHNKLWDEHNELWEEHENLQKEHRNSQQSLEETEIALADAKRDHNEEKEDLTADMKRALEFAQQKYEASMEKLKAERDAKLAAADGKLKDAMEDQEW
jgi:hypothetical protein